MFSGVVRSSDQMLETSLSLARVLEAHMFSTPRPSSGVRSHFTAVLPAWHGKRGHQTWPEPGGKLRQLFLPPSGSCHPACQHLSLTLLCLILASCCCSFCRSNTRPGPSQQCHRCRWHQPLLPGFLREETASNCARKGSDWTSGGISSWKRCSGIGRRCPGRFWSPHAWRCPRNNWM